MSKELDTYDYHEALDRAAMMSSIFDSNMLEHSAVQGTESLKAMAEEISDKLGAFYQACGNAAGEFDDAEHS